MSTQACCLTAVSAAQQWEWPVGDLHLWMLGNVTTLLPEGAWVSPKEDGDLEKYL